jgi:predicted nuclease of predicted toxin-antitoxin system
MKFLANENIPRLSIILLRNNDFDINAISEISPGISDQKVLSIGEDENRIIITFDRDYGELIFQKKLEFSAGLIYLRFIPQTPLEPGELLLKILRNNDLSFNGKFTIIDKDKIRQRPLLL